MELHGLIKVAQETTLLEISEKADGKIVERCGSIRMAVRAEE